MKINRAFFLCLSFSFCIFFQLNEATSFRNDRYQLNAEIPHKWEAVPPDSSRHFHFEHRDLPATISVTVHLFNSPITLNAFQLMHMSSRFDGWQNVFERPASSEELQRANVQESKVALYTKNVLNDSTLKLDKYVAGEYYYLNQLQEDNAKGVVITVKSTQDVWKSIQRDAKEFVKNFWIGNTRQSSSIEQSTESSTVTPWTSIGITPSNTFSTSTSLSLHDGLNLQWNIPSSGERYAEMSALLYDDTAIIHTTGSLSAYSLSNGRQSWDYQLPSAMSAYPNFSGGLLSMVTDTSPSKLYALFANNGSTFYEKTLMSQSFSVPISNGSSLFLFDRSNVFSFHLGSGQRLWSQPLGRIMSDAYPVVSANRLAVPHDDTTLSLLSTQDGSTIWSTSFEGTIRHTPVIGQTRVFIWTNNPRSRSGSDQLHAIDMSDGAILWTFEFPLPGFESSSSVSFDAENILLTFNERDPIRPFRRSRKHILIDSESGQFLWQHDSLASQAHPSFRPIISNRFVFDIVSQSPNLYILDRLTGESIPITFTHKKNNAQSNTVFTVDAVSHVQLIGPYLLLRYQSEEKWNIGIFI